MFPMQYAWSDSGWSRTEAAQKPVKKIPAQRVATFFFSCPSGSWSVHRIARSQRSGLLSRFTLSTVAVPNFCPAAESVSGLPLKIFVDLWKERRGGEGVPSGRGRGLFDLHLLFQKGSVPPFHQIGSVFDRLAISFPLVQSPFLPAAETTGASSTDLSYRFQVLPNPLSINPHNPTFFPSRTKALLVLWREQVLFLFSLSPFVYFSPNFTVFSCSCWWFSFWDSANGIPCNAVTSTEGLLSFIVAGNV